MLEELREKQEQEVKLREELEGMKESLRSEKESMVEVQSNLDKIRLVCNEKDRALQVSEVSFIDPCLY